MTRSLGLITNLLVGVRRAFVVTVRVTCTMCQFTFLVFVEISAVANVTDM